MPWNNPCSVAWLFHFGSHCSWWDFSHRGWWQHDNQYLQYLTDPVNAIRNLDHLALFNPHNIIPFLNSRNQKFALRVCVYLANHHKHPYTLRDIRVGIAEASWGSNVLRLRRRSNLFSFRHVWVFISYNWALYCMSWILCSNSKPKRCSIKNPVTL